MLVVIFEVISKPKNMAGLMSTERFESLANHGKYLALSSYRDKVSAKTSRNTVEHRAAQAE
jgi:hypothetical protein